MTDARRYGEWAGNPKGTKEDPARCVEEVCGADRWPVFHQCRRKRGYGPGGAYCRQHGKRQQEREERDRTSA